VPAAEVIIMAIDEGKLNAFMGKVVADAGATLSAALVVIGDRLGLYKAMAAAGPLTPDELATRTGTNERYVREWLHAQASGGYATYDATTGKFRLDEEQAFALAEDTSPAACIGAFLISQAAWNGVDAVAERFRTGGGISWGAQHPCLFEGTERFFRASYVGNLVTSWIPALDGVSAKLEAGALVADVGCGLGASTILMAKAFPKSLFRGFDSHEASIALARKRAKDAGVSDRVTFDVAKATDFPGQGYDLVAHFDCLHDLEDPAGAARRVRETIASEGTWMIVEPFASDRPEENHNAVGRVYYSGSTMICVPHSLSCGGPALGAQAGEARLRALAVESAGFKRFRRATHTPFNLVLEARP
jgi:2-polyprenyl-3-methyl-5-hydroxy-6-metoxy-1,4-benzoquinol methylase